MSHGRIDNRYLVVATILGLAAIGAFTTMAMTIGEDFAIPALIALGVVGAVIFKGPVGKALGRRLENGAPADPSPDGVVRVLRPERYLALYVSDSFKKSRGFQPIGL